MAEHGNAETLVTSTLPLPTSPSLPRRPPHRRHQSEYTPWHFPGPSSRFNSKLEKSYSSVSPASPRDYVPASPVLSTAVRAQHRRVRSSANVPTLRANALLSPASTPATIPPASKFARSPLSGFSSARSSISTDMSPTVAHYGPVTPSHRAHLSARPSSKLQDSPFSDYFTDDGRSPEPHSGSAPSPEMQALLIRLNRLPAQLIRGERDNESEMVAIVGRKVAEMEAQLSSVHAQTRLPVELEDSGLFMEEDADEDEEEDGKASAPSRHDTPTHDDVFNPAVTEENRKAEHDFLLLEAQRILGSVRKAEENLRKRHAELQELNERYVSQVEEISTQLDALDSERDSFVTKNEELRSENATLRRDMVISNHELLWLKMQFQALKLEVRAGDEGAERLERYAPQLKEDIQAVKRERLARRWKAWEEDWKDVERRLGRRKRRYNNLTTDEEQELGADDEFADADYEEEDGWRVEKVTEEGGKTQRIVLTRISLDAGETIEEELSTVDEDAVVESIEEDDGVDETSELSLDIDLVAVESTLDSFPWKPTYEDQSTQTDAPGSSSNSTSTSSWILANAEGASDDEQNEEDECAITTSPPSEADFERFSDDDTSEYEEEIVLRSSSPVTRTAWQELWTGLTHLAGMGEGD